jgi:ATP-binding cassette subfamily C protein
VRLLIEFLRQYPRQCLLVWGCLVLAGIGEGISLSTLLPLLSLAAGTAHGAGDSGATQMLTHALHFFALSPTLPVMVVLVVLGLLLKTGLTLAAYRQVGYTVAHIATDCRLALLRALSNSRWEYFLRQRSGSLTNAIATEASRSAAAFQSCTNTSALLSQSVVFLIVALLVNWRAAVLAMGIGVVIFTLLRKLVRVSRRAGNRQKDMFRALLALLTDSLTSLKPLKSMAREADIDHLLERATHKLNRALRKEVLSREALKALQELLVGLMLVLIVVLSLVLWHLKLAEIMVLTVVLTRLLTKLTKLQQAYQKLAVGEAFYWSLQAAIKEAQNAREPAFGRWPPTLRQGIRLEQVGFGYDQHRVFDGVDMDIPAGRFTAIIGFSGAGKTTLVDLIIGLLRTDSGRVLIDGVGIDDIDIRAWRGMIGYVPQNTVLLHDTIFANVAVGDDQITAENAIWALKKAGAWGFIESLPEGMDTEVGEHGNRFSGGQRQRILIARALVHRPKLLILDEATSALDPETEKAVSQTLRNLGADYTVISISHRSLLTELADRVYRIENGHAIIEQRAVQRVSGMV